jgi:branched-chain amino acid transport system ATP-binding protein
MTTLFETHDLRKRFHGLVATDHVSLRIRKGEIHALIGPNGAGKSTLVNLISGLLPADGGEILPCRRTPGSMRACRAAFR